MSRVLLLCPEPLGHGQPAGVGIRFLEIARVLRNDGHAVVVLSPDAGPVEGCERGPADSASIHAATRSSDVAVVQGHIANDLFATEPEIPVVVDLYDPFLVENLHYYRERGGEVYRHDHATLMRSILRGDFFLCASAAQRFFYLGLMLAAARLNPALFQADPRLESLIAVAPFGVREAREIRPRDVAAPAILFGGIYDWYDPVCAIDAVAIVRETLPGATLTFTRHPNPDLTPQGKLAEAMAHAERIGGGFVRFVPWAPYGERAAFFETFALALVTFHRSLETDLSMRTRAYDFLWCGLPLVTSSAPGIDEILEHHGAGSVIPVGAPEAFANEIVAILDNPQRYDTMVRGTQRFVRDHPWEHTLAPLREFCLAPRVERTRERFAVSPVETAAAPTFLERLRRRLRA